MCLELICAKVLLLGYVVTMVMVVRAQMNDSPCPRTFRYEVDQNGQLYGAVGIYSFDENVVQLNVELSVGNDVSNYNGRIELATPKDQVVRTIQQQRPINYRVYFPQWRNTPPRVTQILVNGQVVCTGSPVQYNQWIDVITRVNLQHRFTATVQPLRSRPNQNNGYENNPFLSPNGVKDFGKTNNVNENGSRGRVRPNEYPIQVIIPQNNGGNTYDTEFFDLVLTTTTKPPTRRTTTTRAPRPTASRSNSNPGGINDLLLPDNPNRTPSSVLRVCGIPSVNVIPLIVNGQSVPRGSSPWLVAMFASTGTGVDYQCSGSLVSKKHVITAAHCVERRQRKISPDKLLLILGKYSIENLLLREGEKMVGAEEIHIHPDYVPRTSDADIAVVVLSEEIQFTKYITPICIWSETDDLDAVVGERGRVIGWGKDENNRSMTSEPRQVVMPIVSQAQCLRSGEAFRHITSERTFCAGDRNLSGPCSGDSGSGFIMKRRNRWFLKGIVSISTYDPIKESCDLSNYVVFTDVSKFRTWLFSIIDI